MGACSDLSCVLSSLSLLRARPMNRNKSRRCRQEAEENSANRHRLWGVSPRLRCKPSRVGTCQPLELLRKVAAGTTKFNPIYVREHGALSRRKRTMSGEGGICGCRPPTVETAQGMLPFQSHLPLPVSLPPHVSSAPLKFISLPRPSLLRESNTNTGYLLTSSRPT